MKLISLTILTMMAFASNSILTRMAIDGGYIDPSSFAWVRVGSGALVLGLIVLFRGNGLPLLERRRLPGAISLTIYMIGFTLAYLTLDAGLGALILFGVVQIAMFAHGALTGIRPSLRQVTGAALAFSGLVIALWPGAGAVTDPTGAALMVLAGLGWAAYTIIGRTSADPLATTSASFVLCLPMVLVMLAGTGLHLSLTGVILGIICGGLTSGLGYALWYHVLPQMAGATAAVVQLSAPIIAIAAGAVLLGETVGLTLVVATVLVIGGIGWAVTSRSPQADHS